MPPSAHAEIPLALLAGRQCAPRRYFSRHPSRTATPHTPHSHPASHHRNPIRGAWRDVIPEPCMRTKMSKRPRCRPQAVAGCPSTGFGLLCSDGRRRCCGRCHNNGREEYALAARPRETPLINGQSTHPIAPDKTAPHSPTHASARPPGRPRGSEDTNIDPANRKYSDRIRYSTNSDPRARSHAHARTPPTLILRRVPTFPWSCYSTTEW